MATSTDAEDPELPASTPRGSLSCLSMILSYNGKEFTDSLPAQEHTPTEAHTFDILYQALEIEHRLTNATTAASARCQAMGHVTSIEAMKRWFAENERRKFRRSQKAERFIKKTTESSRTWRQPKGGCPSCPISVCATNKSVNGQLFPACPAHLPARACSPSP